MPERGKIIEEINFLSDLLSQRARAFSVGVLAFCWAFVLEDELSIKDLMVPGAFAVLALILDSVQYIAGLILNIAMLRHMEREEIEALNYDQRHPLYRARQIAFSLKLISTVVSIASIIWILVVLYWIPSVSE